MNLAADYMLQMAQQQTGLADLGAYGNVHIAGFERLAESLQGDDRLSEAQGRQASDSGVNLDEELTNLTTYQQAYAAGARLLSTVDQLYQTLLQIQ